MLKRYSRRGWNLVHLGLAASILIACRGNDSPVDGTGVEDSGADRATQSVPSDAAGDAACSSDGPQPVPPPGPEVCPFPQLWCGMEKCGNGVRDTCLSCAG